MLVHLFLSFLAILVARVSWKRWNYDLHNIPSPPGLPFIGHTPKLLKVGREAHFAHLMGQIWNDLGQPKLFKLSISGSTSLYVHDMDFVKTHLLSKTDPFPKRPSSMSNVVNLVGNDKSAKRLLDTEHVTPYVKAIRNVYAAGMQSSVLKKQFPKVMAVIDSMTAIIDAQRKDGAIDFQHLSVRMTLDAIGVVALDTDLGGLDGSGALHQLLLDVGYIVFERFFSFGKRLTLALFPNSESVKSDEKIIDRLTAEWDRLTKEIAERPDPDDEERPLWARLKNLVDPETGEKLTHEGLRAEIATMILAGMDTTGHQLAWILNLLATYPGVTKKLVHELEEHKLCGVGARELKFEDLGDLQYLTGVIKEGMRIALSISAIILRVVPRDMTIFGYRVPKGTYITCLNNRWMNSVTEWGDPDVFRPERWLTDEDMSHKYLLGFGYGARDCVGQRLAMMEIRMAIVQILKQYELTPVTPFDKLAQNCKNGVAVEAKEGIWLHVTPRSF